MLPHFIHLFWRTIHGMPLLVSSNWANWGLGLAVFVLYEGLAIAVRGWPDMKSRWKQNVGIGLLATAGGYLIIFICSAIVTTYDEHHDSTGRWQVVVNEKNNFKTTLQQRDFSIETLKVEWDAKQSENGRLGKQIKELRSRDPTVITKTVPGAPAPEQPKQCWMAQMYDQPNPNVKEAKTGTLVMIYCNYKIEAPFTVSIKFDRDFLEGIVELPGMGAMFGGGGPKSDHTFFGGVTAPSLPAYQMVIVKVDSADKTFPGAIEGRVWSN